MTRWLAFLLLLSSTTYANGLRVGSAAINLEADDSMVIAGGIGPGKATGQEGQLRVTAIVIEKPRQGKVVIGDVDVLFLTRDFVDRALAEVQRTTGIPPESVLINATHTHMAPSISTIHGYGVDPVFVKRVEDGIVKAIQQANANLNDARFFFHLGEEKTIGNNSRWLTTHNEITWSFSKDAVRPTGPFDPQLPVLAFKGPQDKLLALIYNHSTHTIGAIKPGVRSPGFYGLAAQELEREYGNDAHVVFLEGASGSTHNITLVPPAIAVTRLKAAVNDALKQADEHAVDRLVSVKRKFNFTVRTFDEAEEDKKVERYCRLYGHPDSQIEVFRAMRKALALHQGETRETWLQVMLIGDVAIVGVPAEYFTGLGVDIKKRSLFKNTFVAELANDWIGYLPDRQAHELGGYQTWMGQHSYAEIGTGERVADEVIAMLNDLHAERR